MEQQFPSLSREFPNMLLQSHQKAAADILTTKTSGGSSSQKGLKFSDHTFLKKETLVAEPKKGIYVDEIANNNKAEQSSTNQQTP